MHVYRSKETVCLMTVNIKLLLTFNLLLAVCHVCSKRRSSLVVDTSNTTPNKRKSLFQLSLFCFDLISTAAAAVSILLRLIV